MHVDKSRDWPCPFIALHLQCELVVLHSLATGNGGKEFLRIATGESRSIPLRILREEEESLGIIQNHWELFRI